MSNISAGAYTRMEYKSNVIYYNGNCKKESLGQEQKKVCQGVLEKMMKGQQSIIQQIEQENQKKLQARQETHRRVQEAVRKNPYAFAHFV